MEHVEAERQESQKRHIVGDQHGTDERDKDQTEHAHAGGPETLHDRSCHRIEEADVPKSAYDGEHAEQTGQRAQVEIAEIRAVHGNENGRREGENEGDHHDGVLPDKPEERRQDLIVRIRSGMRRTGCRYGGTILHERLSSFITDNKKRNRRRMGRGDPNSQAHRSEAGL